MRRKNLNIRYDLIGKRLTEKKMEDREETKKVNWYMIGKWQIKKAAQKDKLLHDRERI